MLGKYKFLFLIFLSFYFLNASELKTVNLQLQWKNQFQFAGFYMAKEKGYYADIGLHVNIKEFNNNINVVNGLLSGEFQYAVSRASSLIDISKGKDIVYSSAIYQTSPIIILAQKSSRINSISDFKNKKIMVTYDQLNDPSIISIFSSQKFNAKDLKFISHTFDVKDLINKKTDLMVSYISNEPYLLKELGKKPVVFSPQDYGFDFYSDLIISSREYFIENQEEVKDFSQATIKGFKYAFDNIDESIKIIQKNYNSQNKSYEALRYEAEKLKEIFYAKKDDIGKVDPIKLEKIYDIFKLLGLVKDEVNFKNIIVDNLINKIKFTNTQTQYLKDKKSINFCIDPNWMPYDKIDKHGNYIGISSDFIKIFEQKTNTKFNLIKTSTWEQSVKFAQSGKCDIITSVVKTPLRSEFLNFTTEYIKVPIVAVTRLNVAFINKADDLENKPIGLVKDYAIADIISNMQDNLNITKVNSVSQGLDMVKNAKLYAFVGSLNTIVYELQSKNLQNLKISGKIYDDLKLHIGVVKNDEILLGILNKVINTISHEKSLKIVNKWALVAYESVVDYTLVWKIVFICCVLIILFAYWGIKISHTNKLLKEAQAEIERKNQQLILLASTDKLTQIHNRVRIDELLELQIQKAQKLNIPFAIALLDIDLFKNINDKYGHQVGDKVLSEIAEILKDSIRQTDSVGRWGGEEFLIILPGISSKNLFKIVDSLRLKIKNHLFTKAITSTASFGCSTYMQGDKIQTIVKRADDGLYMAKRSGRDKVVQN